MCIHLYDYWYDHQISDKTIKKNIKGSSQIENYKTIETIIVLTQKNGSNNHFIRFVFQFHMNGLLNDIPKAENY